jgi:hypothetical protein
MGLIHGDKRISDPVQSCSLFLGQVGEFAVDPGGQRSSIISINDFHGGFLPLSRKMFTGLAAADE